MLVAESLHHLLDHFAYAPVHVASNRVEERAIDENGVEDLPDVVAPESAALPVIAPGDRSSSLAYVLRE